MERVEPRIEPLDKVGFEKLDVAKGLEDNLSANKVTIIRKKTPTGSISSFFFPLFNLRNLFYLSTISELNKKAYSHIEDSLNHHLQGEHYPVYVNGIYLRQNWGGEFENVAILVAIAVNEDGYCEVLSAAEGMKEAKAPAGSAFSSGCAAAAWMMSTPILLTT